MSKDAVLVKPLYTEVDLPKPHLIQIHVQMRELVSNTPSSPNKSPDNKHYNNNNNTNNNNAKDNKDNRKFKTLGTPFLMTVGSWFSIADIR